MIDNVSFVRECSANSPDLNPTEHLGDRLKLYVAVFTVESDLDNALIQRKWSAILQNYNTCLID